MAIRLNGEHRHYLKGVMRSTVSCPAEEAADSKAYAKVEALMNKAVSDRFPQADMRVLRKYGKSSVMPGIIVQLEVGGVVQFDYRLSKHDSQDDLVKAGYPLQPFEDDYNSRRLIFLADAKMTRAYEEHKTALAALEKIQRAKYVDYHALIDGASTLEQIEEVWPEAGALLRKRINATLPVVLSDEVMSRIRADSSTRKKNAKVVVSQDFSRRAPKKTIFREQEVIEDEYVESDDD